MTIGVLALQGDFDSHRRMLESCGAHVITVRDPAALEECDALVVPGGESTVMSRLCERYALWEPLRTRIEEGMGVFGTCAGMILLARNIQGATRNFEQKILGALDIDVERNAYGAQIDSFESDLQVPDIGEEPLHAVFIRVPRVTRCGAGVSVLAFHGDEPVVVRQGNVMACSFHPEIAGDARLHELWLSTLDTSEEND